MADGLDDVAGAGLALGADHRRALADPAQRLAEVGRAAHERDLEAPLVDVVGLVGRRQDLGLVDVVDLERLEHLRLGEVADARLGHDGDRHGLLDALDHHRIGHARDPAVTADVGRNALERHDRDRARVLGDLRLLGIDDVHDDAALQHLGQTGLYTERRLVSHCLTMLAGALCTIRRMATDDPDLIGPDEVAFTLDLTPAQLKIVHAALRSMRDDFGHDQHDVHKIIHELLAKLPDEASIRSIDIDTGR